MINRKDAPPAVRGTSRAAEADWELYRDWCTATGRDPHHTGWADLSAMLTDLPASTTVQDRRLRHIRRALGHGKGGLPRPVVTLRSRIGPDWASYPDALAALRHEWWPDGVAARRDALIITLAARGFTRIRIRRLQPATVQVFPEPVIDGLTLNQHSDPVLCPACALTRWLQILDAYQHRSGRDIEDLLASARTHSRLRHDCLDTVGDGWWTARYVIPAVDQHGGIALGSPISGRGLTAMLCRRFTPEPVAIAPPPQQRIPRRPTGDRDDQQVRVMQQQIGRLYDQIGEEADALNARIRALLDGIVV